MRTTIFGVVIAAFLALSLFAASGQAPAQHRGVLSVLHAGQQVAVKDVGGRYEISMFENGPDLLSHKLIEVGPDYLVIRDIAAVSETRIPMWSIKAVVTLNLAAQKAD
jgi:hypothetical protein